MWPFKKKVKPLPPPGAMAAKLIYVMDNRPHEWVQQKLKGEILNPHLGMTLHKVHLYAAWSMNDLNGSFYYFNATDTVHILAAMERLRRRQEDHKTATEEAQKYNDIAYAVAKLDKYQENGM